MKRLSLILAVAIFTLTSVPAFAEATKEQKDECLLASANCTEQANDIYTRVARLDKEIKKGTKVYTPAELNKLKAKLQEASEILKSLEEGGN